MKSRTITSTPDNITRAMPEPSVFSDPTGGTAEGMSLKARFDSFGIVASSGSLINGRGAPILSPDVPKVHLHACEEAFRLFMRERSELPTDALVLEANGRV